MKVSKAQDGVPLPPAFRRTSKIYEALQTLEPGQSFFVETDNAPSVRAAALKYAVMLHIECATRIWAEDGVDGLRIWRVK